MLKSILFACCLLIGQLLLAQNSDASEYKSADSLAYLYQGHGLTNLPVLAIKLTQGLKTDRQKYRAIFKWVCQNIKNDYSMFQKISAKRKRLQNKPDQLKQWNLSLQKEFVYQLLENKKTICSGYALLIRELCYAIGIEAIIIDGFSKDANGKLHYKGIPNHSWNAVKIDDAWYLSDPTWASGYIDGNLNLFIPQYRNAYFLVNPDRFWRSHFPLESEWLLIDSLPSLTQFIDGPLVYQGLMTGSVLPGHFEKRRFEHKKGIPKDFKVVVQ